MDYGTESARSDNAPRFARCARVSELEIDLHDNAGFRCGTRDGSCIFEGDGCGFFAQNIFVSFEKCEALAGVLIIFSSDYRSVKGIFTFASSAPFA